jgi:MerR family redox-sensitive transcriptional activator SoxR
VNETTLTIGQLAKRFGLNASAIRFYEREGVLPAPAREGGQRRYGDDAIRRLEVLAVAKRAGFTLDEARLLLQRTEAGTPAFESLRALAARKLPEVEELIVRAEAMRAWLRSAGDCSCATLDVCGLFADDAGPAPAAAAFGSLQVVRVPATATTPV